MKKYIISDEDNKGYYWCVEKGIATDKEGRQIKNFGYWGNVENNLYKGDFFRRVKKMYFIQAILLLCAMKITGLNVDVKTITPLHTSMEDQK